MPAGRRLLEDAVIMATAHNDITGDLLKTKGSNDAYRDGWDRIFGPKRRTTIVETAEPTEEVLFHLRSYGDVTEAQFDECMRTGKITIVTSPKQLHT